MVTYSKSVKMLRQDYKQFLLYKFALSIVGCQERPVKICQSSISKVFLREIWRIMDSQRNQGNGLYMLYVVVIVVVVIIV